MQDDKIVAFKALIERFRGYPRIVIQAHDFPDHDAIASAFALSYLLEQFGIPTVLVYAGEIDRISIQRMIETLGIPIHSIHHTDLSPKDKTIVVDGCIGEKNVTDIIGDEIAVIDHHHVFASDDLWYQDVRPEYGATASIMVEYFDAFHLAIPKDIATGLLIGLNIDTANLTRGFCDADVRAFAALHQLADQVTVNRICRNSLETHELEFYQSLLKDLKVTGKLAVALLPEHCPKNLLGILGDFLISVDTIDVTVLASFNGDTIQLSLRSETQDIDVAEIARKVLNDGNIGFGGGHPHMAGGIAHRQKLPDNIDHSDYILDLWISAIRSEAQTTQR